VQFKTITEKNGMTEFVPTKVLNSQGVWVEYRPLLDTVIDLGPQPSEQSCEVALSNWVTALEATAKVTLLIGTLPQGLDHTCMLSRTGTARDLLNAIFDQIHQYNVSWTLAWSETGIWFHARGLINPNEPTIHNDEEMRQWSEFGIMPAPKQ